MATSLFRRLFRVENALQLLLVFVPVAIVLSVMEAPATAVFITSCLAIIPLAGLMGRATEHLAARMGEGLGGFLNATFGNAAELIIALVALHSGHLEVVKASITGSIIGNCLLVLGLALLLGGARFPMLSFNRSGTTMSTTLLLLGAIGLVVPAAFHVVATESFVAQSHEMGLSLEISIVLFVAYALSLLFTLKTHAHFYMGATEDVDPDGGPTSGHGAPSWGRGKSLLVLLGATALIAWMSELLVHAIDGAASTLGMSQTFVGVIVVAIIGNAAEHSTAVIVALKNRMDLALNIAIGSSLQIALFVAPLLVFASYAFGAPMDLNFSVFEVVAVVLSVAAVRCIGSDGESNWMEGVFLLALYVILGMAFYNLP